jgi:hypothetical protein
MQESKLTFEHQKQLESKTKTALIGCFTAASNVTGQVPIPLNFCLSTNIVALFWSVSLFQAF